MQDLYSGFKKISEDEKQAVLHHENGHKLNIAKSGLSKKHLKALSKLPLHQAEGPQDPTEALQEEPVDLMDTELATRIPTEELLQREVQLPPARRQAPIDYIRGAMFDVLAPPNVRTSLQEVKQEQARFEQEQAAKQPQQAAQPVVTEEVVPTQELPQQESASVLQEAPAVPTQVQQFQEPQAQIAPNVEKPEPRDFLDIAADESLSEPQRMEALLQHDMQIQRQIKNADDEWLNLVKTQKEYDPNRIYNNMGTGQKIQQAIGLLLGAVGAGLTGGENPVIAVINKEIERDIDAQKQERADKFNLYKMHLARLGDERAATLQTLNNLQSVTKAKIDDLLNKRGIGPAGQKTLQAASLALDAQIAKNRSEISSMALQKQFKDRLAKGQVAEMPDELDPNLAKSYRVQIVDPQGNVQTVKRYAKSDASATKAQDLSNKVQRAEEAIRKIALFNTAEGRAMFGEAKAVKQQLYTEALAAMAELQTGGATTRNIEAIKAGVPVPGAFQLGESDAKVRSALQTIQSFKKTLENY